MPTRWETFPVELTGGLVSNLSRLQQGLKQPGSARVLENFEPSPKGGYRRINGFQKFDTALVPAYGPVVVQGSGQTGSTLLVADMHESPTVGDEFTVSGVTGTYSLSSVTYSSSGKSATLNVTPALGSSPADKASLTFTVASSRIEGVYYPSAESKSYVLRGGALWCSAGSGWTRVNTPSYGTVLVAGGSQTGTSLNIDGISSDGYVPQAGDTFSVAGVELVYTLTSNATASSGASTLTVTPALDSAPADNAVVTFISSTHSGASKARFTEFNFDGTVKTVIVDSFNNPAVIQGSTYKKLQGSSDVTGAEYVEEFKDHLFFAKSDLIVYTAPFSEEDFTSASGAGVYRLPSPCTGLITFREQLINFSETSIRKLEGTSQADFTLTSIVNKIGCVSGDTIQEVGGDVLFLGPDGVRFLGATDRIGDFNLSLASRQIQEDFKSFTIRGSEYCTLVLREKNQYRIFKYSSTTEKRHTKGYIGTQFLDQDAQSIDWGLMKGIKAYRSSSTYENDEEVAIFSNDDGYLYQLESGLSFDGLDISSSYYTPFIPIENPTVRKTAYKVETYIDPEGPVNGKLTLKYDFSNPTKIQPPSVDISGGSTFETYGTAVYGESLFGSEPDTVIDSQVVGSFFTVSFQYTFEGGAPFILDTVIMDYSIEDKK